MSNDPFAADLSGNPPPPAGGNRTCLIVALILGGILFMCLCCTGGTAYFIWSNAEKVAAEFANKISPQLAGNAVIQEHIGDINSGEVLWMDSFQHMAETQEQNAFVIELHGSKGEGKLTIQLNPETMKPDLGTGRLKLPDGTVVPLEAPAPPPEDGNPGETVPAEGMPAEPAPEAGNPGNPPVADGVAP